MSDQITKEGFSFDTVYLHSGILRPWAGFYHTKDPGERMTELRGDSVPVSVRPAETFLGRGVRHSFRMTDPACPGHILDWSVTEVQSGEIRGMLFDAVYRNETDAPVYLNAIDVENLPAAPMRPAGKASDWCLSALKGERQFGTLADTFPSENEKTRAQWAGFGLPVPFALPEGEHYNNSKWRIFEEYLTLYTDFGEKGLFVAPAGNPVAFLKFACGVERTPDGGATVLFDVTSDMSNVRVAPGESRAAQQMIFAVAPHDVVVPAVLRHIAATHGSRNTKGPLVGWCSWYDLYDKISEETVCESVNAMAKLSDRVPLEVMQIDDGFQRQLGDWATNEKFPHGWAPIVETISKAGARPGIWLAPALIHNSTEVYRAHPDWFVVDEKGDYWWPADNWGKSAYWLDFSNPDAMRFALDVVRDAKAEGFTYFKIDFNIIRIDGRTAFDPSYTSLELYRKLYAGYRRVLGEDVFLLSCSNFTRGTVGYADASRIGPDSPDVWDQANPCNILECIHEVGQCASANGIFYANDPDVTYLKCKLTDEEHRTWHTMVGLLGGMQMISDPMAKRTEQLRMLEILNPPAPDKALQIHPAVDKNHQRFGFLAKRPYGDFASVMVWNPADEEATVMTELWKLREIGEEFHVWSFWDGEYLGVHNMDFPLALPAHGCRLMRFTPVGRSGVPLLIGSDLHISLGSAEVKNIRSGEHRMEVILSGAAGARDGALYLYSETPPVSWSATGCASVSCAYEENVVKVSLSSRSRSEDQIVRITF